MKRALEQPVWPSPWGRWRYWREARISHLSPPCPSVEQAGGTTANLPELTLEQAVEQAVANNSSLKTASLETRRAADDLAAKRTRRFANTQFTALGAQLLTKPSVTFPEGSLGVYGATGPIPATNQKVEIARKPAGIVNVSVAQPLSTQYQLHLQLKALELGLEGTRQDQEKTRLEVVDQVQQRLLRGSRGTERFGQSSGVTPLLPGIASSGSREPR